MNASERSAADRDEVCTAWLGAQDSDETAGTYRYVVGEWFRWCDRHGIDVWEVRRRDVDRWRQGLRRRLAGRTVGKYLSALASFYRFAITESDGAPIEHNPVDNVKRPRIARVPHGDALTADEAERLRAASLAEPRTAALVHLLLTGIRVSEAIGARVRDLGWDGDDRGLTITRKGGHKDLVVIDPDDFAVIEHYLQTRKPVPDGWLLATTGGRRMSRQTAYRIVSELAAKTLRRPVVIGPHDIRRTVITLAFEEGMPAQEVRALAGHSSIATTQLYDRNVHTRGRKARAAVKVAMGRQRIGAGAPNLGKRHEQR